jgi:hypothetical protein
MYIYHKIKQIKLIINKFNMQNNSKNIKYKQINIYIKIN